MGVEWNIPARTSAHERADARNEPHYHNYYSLFIFGHVAVHLRVTRLPFFRRAPLRPCASTPAPRYEEQLAPPWRPELSGEADTRYFRVLSRLIDADTAGEVEGEAVKLFRRIEDDEKKLPPPLD